MQKLSWHKQKIVGIIVAGFLLAVSLAQISYVQSTFLNEYFNLEIVSVIFFLAYAIAFMIMNYYPNIIAKFNNLVAALTVLFLEIISLMIFIALPYPVTVFLAFLTYVVCINIIFINFDIFLESYTADAKTGQIRGIYMTIYNLGWVISPYISGRILEALGFNWLFGLVIVLLLPIILILRIKFANFKNHYSKKSYKISKTLKELFKHPNLQRIFYIAFLLQIFYAVMVIYTPIYLNQYIGFDWKQIGLIFSIMLLPFVLIEYPAGYIADKFLGEKEMLTGGLLIMGLSSLAIFIFPSTSIVFWAFILFVSRIGASLTEIMRDTYFFKKVPVEKIEIINAFRSTMPLAYIVVPLIFAVILYFLPINFVFLVLFIILLSGLIPLAKLKDTK